MKHYLPLLAAAVMTWPVAWTAPLPPPPAGQLYHGSYPGGITGEEDDITPNDVRDYEKVVGQKPVWIYFSNNWYASRKFPLATATWIREGGAIPFIRLMLRSKNHHVGKPEKYFSLQAIIDGKFDADLRDWGRAAAAFATPLLVEYGTEVNGEWFGWNGKFQGGGRTKGFGDPTKPDGPERFVAAYRHIIETIRAAGATNITWVFHLDSAQSPEDDWNRFENYYPGSDVIDWVAVSCYGPQKPHDGKEENISFRDKFDPVYPRIVKMAPGKPLVVIEFGCTSGCPHVKAEDWAAAALKDIFGRRWPAICGFAWWNEKWENDTIPSHNTTMRVQDNPALGDVFRKTLEASTNKLAPLAHSD